MGCRHIWQGLMLQLEQVQVEVVCHGNGVAV